MIIYNFSLDLVGYSFMASDYKDTIYIHNMLQVNNTYN